MEDCFLGVVRESDAVGGGLCAALVEKGQKAKSGDQRGESDSADEVRQIDHISEPIAKKKSKADHEKSKTPKQPSLCGVACERGVRGGRKRR